MAVVEIPIDNQNPAFKFFTDLENVTYGFRFKFNTRVQIWIVDILDRNDDTILYTVPFYSNRDMTEFAKLQGVPPGILAAINESQSDDDADRFTFSLDVKFLYDDLKDEAV